MIWNKFFKYLFPLVVLAVGLRLFILQIVLVDTHRLEPLLFPGELVMAHKISKPKREDLVTFRCLEKRMCVGRILGLAGDRLDIRGLEIKVNEQKQLLLHFSDASQLSLGEEDRAAVVSPESYFVEGDQFGEILSTQVEAVITRVAFSFDPETRKVRWARIWLPIH